MELKKYIDEAVSPYMAVKAAGEYLSGQGYDELRMDEPWQLKKGGRYFVKIYDTSLFAFVPGGKVTESMKIKIAAAHTDYPCFRVKPKAEICDNGYLKLNVECYGGAILNTWLDRPLSISGKVCIKAKENYDVESVIIDFGRPIMTIPNLAIHMNREVNKGVELNKQTQLLPIAALLKKEMEENLFLEALAEEINKTYDYEIRTEDILDFDLYVYNADKTESLGINNEFISAPRLDNLTSCYACLTGLSQVEDELSLIALYDNEEVGSRSKQGADSAVLRILIEKIYDGLGFDLKHINEAIFKSMMLSVDVAHAYHPNYGNMSDPNLKVVCGNGFAIKLNYSQKYATDTLAVAELQQLCEKEKISYQKYVNRSDIAGGGTIGSILSSNMPIRTVDIGVPVLAMHSARELMAEADAMSLCRLLKAFFSKI